MLLCQSQQHTYNTIVRSAVYGAVRPFCLILDFPSQLRDYWYKLAVCQLCLFSTWGKQAMTYSVCVDGYDVAGNNNVHVEGHATSNACTKMGRSALS